MAPAAFAAKQGRLDQQFGQHQPVLQIHLSAQLGLIAARQLQALSWLELLQLLQLGPSLQGLALLPHPLQGLGQGGVAPLDPRHLPAQLAQLLALLIEPGRLGSPAGGQQDQRRPGQARPRAGRDVVQLARQVLTQLAGEHQSFH